MKQWWTYADSFRLAAGFNELQQVSYESRLMQLQTGITDLAARARTNRCAQRLENILLSIYRTLTQRRW
ncbi:hypothetical protein KIH39_08095 [Telmatocola sphagniphila]|uniref:Uncharacterized protein n=1 Tax=Telmatocola sphagniphila TaxID=1123043 RepID=A0A8E6B9F9_9BACT|nr:hypothetical protein [Telmatocola sphagniphila]QVL33854.1 hypothetical protein KIH39_08095 [Telmatocola sphagniphila]